MEGEVYLDLTYFSNFSIKESLKKNFVTYKVQAVLKME